MDGKMIFATRANAFRSTILASFILIWGTSLVDAKCEVVRDIAPGQMGINYHGMRPEMVAFVFSQGEMEFRKKTDFNLVGQGERRGLVRDWNYVLDGISNGSLPITFTGAISEISFEQLRVLTPVFFKNVYECLPQADAKYEYIQKLNVNSADTELEYE